MTSERGIPAVVEAAHQSLRESADLAVVLVGDPAQLEPELARHPRRERLSVHPASQMIGMNEEPGQAFKAKKDASVSVALRLVADGGAEAAVSPGNTGASVVAATLTLGRLSGVRRPGIVTLMPNPSGFTGVLDAGAVVDCKPEDLVLFGVMGSLLLREVMRIEKPRIGILSIGEEDIKGNEQSLAAFEMMKKANLNFVGNVEGRDLFNGRVDVAVCDGFVGNIVLKTAEGLAKMIFEEIRESFKRGGPLVKLGGMLGKGAFRDLHRHLNADEYGGAILLGVNGNCIIAHGSANHIAIKNAILLGRACAEQGLVQKLGEKIKQHTGVAA